VLLGLAAEVPDIGNRVRLVPALAPPDPTKALDGGPDETAEDDCVVDDLDGEAVAGLYAEPPPRLAWYDDLMLGADLDA